MEALKKSGGPAIAVINKTDLVKDAADLDARKAELKALGVFDDVDTVSVRENDHCEELFDALSRYAVEGPHYFDDDAYTDMPEKELVAEVIRVKGTALYAGRDPPWHWQWVVNGGQLWLGDLVDPDVDIYRARQSLQGHGHWQGRCDAEKDRQRGPH